MKSIKKNQNYYLIYIYIHAYTYTYIYELYLGEKCYSYG